MSDLTESVSSLEQKEDTKGFPHSKYFDTTPSRPCALEYTEEPNDYRPGGLHPIHIEDSLDSGRYTVIHKLGYGLSSTVWLARDVTLNTYVAIKILTAEASKTRNELRCLELLSSKPRSKHPGQEYISASFLDRHFWLDGPNGQHLILVSKASGPSVSHMSNWNIRIRESLARRIALQVTQGLAYLHSRGICHGNLTSSDVLFQLADFDAWTQEEVYEQLGIPMVIDVDESFRGPSFPRYLVDSAQFFRASPGLLAENIRIIDYGDSFRVKCSNNPSTDQRPWSNGFIPPENLCGLKYMQSSDLWALGCIIYEIRAGLSLFPLSVDASPSDSIWEISDTIGPEFDGDGHPGLSGKSRVPDKSRQERIFRVVAEIDVEPSANSEGAMTGTRGLEESRNIFAQIRPYIKSDPNLFWKPLTPVGTTLVDTLIRTWAEIKEEFEMWKSEKPPPKISPVEAKQLSSLLSAVLSYLPKQRKSAASLAKHPWFAEPASWKPSTMENPKKLSPIKF